MRTKISQEMIDEIIKKRKEGKSHRQIGRELGINSKVSRKYCILNGIDSPERLVNKITPCMVERIVYLYRQGVRPYRISDETGIPRTTVRTILEKTGEHKPVRYGSENKGNFSKPLPKAVDDPVFYPERKVVMKSVKIKGKKYTDVSGFYGI